MENGYLNEEHNNKNNKKLTLVTDKGAQIEIKSETRTSVRGGTFQYITYGKKAQELIVENRYKIFGDREKTL